MNAPMPILDQRSLQAHLVTLAEKDVNEMACFVAAQSERTTESVEAHLRWFLLENPARHPEDPLGFGLRLADQLAGCILCVPQAFRLGNERIP